MAHTHIATGAPAVLEASIVNDHALARVKQRSIGSLFFSIFGGLWLAVSALAFGLLSRWVLLLLACGVLGFVAVAVWLMRAVPAGAEPEPERERDGTMFAVVNAGQGVAIFLDFFLANTFHKPDWAFPIAVLIVGLHIFALPRSYWMASNLVTGAVLVVDAAVCMVVLRGDAMVGAVTMGAGLTLWCSAVWKLVAAFELLRAARAAPV